MQQDNLRARVDHLSRVAAAIHPAFIIYHSTLTLSRMVCPFADDLISPVLVCLREIKIKATLPHGKFEAYFNYPSLLRERH